MFESASNSRMEEKKWSEMGLYRTEQWRSRKSSLGGHVGNGKYDYNVDEMDQGAVTLVIDLAKAFGHRTKIVLAWAMFFAFPQRILGVCCGYFQHL